MILFSIPKPRSKKIKFFHILLILCIPQIIRSQEITTIELLKRKLDTSAAVKTKVDLYADLSWEYALQESDSALYFSEKGITLSKEKNYPLGEAISLSSKGLYYEMVANDFEKASNAYFEGIAICEKHKLPYIETVYHNLGVMFHTSDNYDKARKYYTLAYDLAVNKGDLDTQKNCLINLGSIASTLEDYDLAESLMLRGLEINLRDDLNYDVYVNLGNVYYRKEEYSKALPYHKKAIEPIKENYYSEHNLHYYINTKLKLQDTSNLKSAIVRAEEFVKNQKGIRQLSFMTLALSNYHRAYGDLTKGIGYQEQYLKILEEIKDKQRDDIVLELEAKYETEKKDAQLKVLSLENEKAAQQQKLYLYLALVGLIAALSISYFFYKNRQKNKLLAKQKVLLEASIDEKNTLLKETHHRVKNSFQIVSSLLYLQSENIEDKEAQLAVKEAQNRVRSMVLIHQKLYNKDQLVGINTQEYFEDLTKDILESHQLQDQNISYNLDVAPLVLGIETITPIGLILNELITNCLKHAFENSSSDNQVSINFREERNTLVLEVIDNGTGIEGEVKASSFGIKLIKALSKKLKATLEYGKIHPKGTQATLIINRYEKL